MLSTGFRMALAGLAFSATVTAVPSLSLHVSGPQTVNGVESSTLVTTITNTCNETLKLLNDPSGPLSTDPTDTFIIRDAAGRKPSFIGIKLTYSPSMVVHLENDQLFTILSPGESVNIEHNLSMAYSFIHPGAYRFEARHRFYYVEPIASAAVSIYAHAVAHNASISSRLAVTRQSPAPATALQKRVYFGCSSTQIASLAAAAASAQDYAANAMIYMLSYDQIRPGLRYTTWFGDYTVENWKVVADAFINMHNLEFSALNYDCTCKNPSIIAETTILSDNLIRLCPQFWTLPLDGVNSMAGTLVHESTHLERVADTIDHESGVEDCLLLARSTPLEAIQNGDSYEYFAENPFQM